MCIAGCTLWSANPVFGKTTKPYVIPIRGMTERKYKQLHEKDLAFIKGCIDYCQEEKKKLVVVTHYAPTKYDMQDYKYLPLYYSDLDELLTKEKVDTWIFGHTHINTDFIHSNGTRVMSNQKGKPKEKINDFQKSMTIEF